MVSLDKNCFVVVLKYHQHLKVYTFLIGTYQMESMDSSPRPLSLKFNSPTLCEINILNSSEALEVTKKQLF